MKFKLMFLLVAAAVAVTAQTTEEGSEAVSAFRSYGDSALVTLLKVKIGCLNRQMTVCENLLTTATRNCQLFVYKDCKDAYDKGIRKSGIYHLDPDNGGSFQAYCNMDIDGGGWTVFQQRKDGSQSFYRKWGDYVKGFGDLKGEHWLGLEKIYRLAKLSKSLLRVDVGEYNNRKAYAKFNSFYLGSAAAKYSLHISGYSGTSGDSLTYHNGMKFSTNDQDNDVWGGNCAATRKGAWWYRSCEKSNLNGLYAGSRRSGYQYMTWVAFTRGCYAIKFSEMKVRRH